MGDAVLRVTTSRGNEWDDPSDGELLGLVVDLRVPDEFFVLERLTDDAGETFLQAKVTRSGDFLLEHRDGGRRRHFAARVATSGLAYATVVAWAHELPGWRDWFPWKRVRA